MLKPYNFKKVQVAISPTIFLNIQKNSMRKMIETYMDRAHFKHKKLSKFVMLMITHFFLM